MSFSGVDALGVTPPVFSSSNISIGDLFEKCCEETSIISTFFGIQLSSLL